MASARRGWLHDAWHGSDDRRAGTWGRAVPYSTKCSGYAIVLEYDDGQGGEKCGQTALAEGVDDAEQDFAHQTMMVNMSSTHRFNHR